MRRPFKLVLAIAAAISAIATSFFFAEPAAADATRRIWLDNTDFCIWGGASDNFGASVGVTDYFCSNDVTVKYFEIVGKTPGGKYDLYRIHQSRAGGACIGVEGVETGDTHIGQTLQLEHCGDGKDDLWYLYRHWPGGPVRIHNYNANHRDLAMQATECSMGGGLCGIQLQEYPYPPNWERMIWELKPLG